MDAKAEGFIITFMGFYVTLLSWATVQSLGAYNNPYPLSLVFWLGIITIIGGILYAIFKSKYEVRRRSSRG